jgi:hypothetical protein
MISMITEILPNTKIVVGGHHVTIFFSRQIAPFRMTGVASFFFSLSVSLAAFRPTDWITISG